VPCASRNSTNGRSAEWPLNSMRKEIPIVRQLQPLLRACWGLACVVVIAGSVLPAASAPIRMLSKLGINDKIEHLGAYALLALLPTVHERWRRLSLLLLLMLLLGVALEFGQLYSPGRSFEIGDMVADATGLLAGFLCGLLLRNLAMSTPLSAGLRSKTD
jgi:VanZ family protein